MPSENLQSIGRYQILSLLGEGGMGLVYKAYDLTLQRNVAIKLMHTLPGGAGGAQERFVQEARAAARLDHPGIVKVHDSGVHEGQFFIVMEYLPGDNLAQILRGLRAARQWIPLPEAAALVRQVALALDYAHQQGVLHRDIKPENIMFKPEPSEGLAYRPVITDLGLARLFDGGLPTQEPAGMGTPAYMSPEQAQGKDSDARSDVYSLGILLYELCTGQPPFHPRNLIEAVHSHTQEQPAAPRAVRPDLPAALEAIILKSIQKEREARYPSAGALAQALSQALLQPQAGAHLAESGGAKTTSLGDSVSLITVHQQGETRQRGDSLVQEFEQAFAAGEKTELDVIQIMGEDVTSRSVPVSKNTLTAGRDAQCDLYLNSSQVSRQHTRIMRRGGAYKVVDLNSTNGTYLNDVRLLPGVPEEWTADKLLRLGNYYLRLVPATLAEQPGADGGQQTEVGDGGGGNAQPAAMPVQVGIALENPSPFVQPGESVTTNIYLSNQGELVEHLSVSVDGLLPAWVTLSPQVVQLLPGKEELIQLTIHPPRDSSSQAGPHPFRVNAAGMAGAGGAAPEGAAPKPAAQCEAVLTVALYQKFSSELHPEIFPSGKHSRLTITNQGNRPESYPIYWRDPGDELLFHPAQTVVQVAEGRSVVTEFWVEPRLAHWFGQERPYRFTVEITRPEAGLRIHSGEFISRPRISNGLLIGLAALVLLFACGLGAMGFFLPGVLFPARATEISPVEATTTLPAAEPTVLIEPTPLVEPTTVVETPLPAPTDTTQPTATSTEAPLAADFSGGWQTNFATINFGQQADNQVSGQYTWYGGVTPIDIRGVVEGSTLRGTVGSAGVEFAFTLAPDGQSFDGRWTSPQGDFHWCGVRGGALPAGCGYSGHWNTISETTPAEQPTADLQQTGSLLRGTFFNGSSHGTLEGTLGAAGNGTHYQVDGLYTVNGYTDRFRWTLKDFNSVQFQGMWQNNEGQHAWCGWRDSSSRPDPCLIGE